MAFLTSTNKSDGSVSNLAMFFALSFIAIWAIMWTVLERLGTFRPLATKVQTVVPRLVTQLKERIA